MSVLLTAVALFAAPPAGEDAAHRADRLRTEQLNRNAAAVVDRRQRADTARDRAWRASQDAYEARLAAWRKRDAERRCYNESLR